MQRTKTKEIKRKPKLYNIHNLIAMDIGEYLDEKYEEYGRTCNCNCMICNPYYGDFWESFVLQDEFNYRDAN